MSYHYCRMDVGAILKAWPAGAIAVAGYLGGIFSEPLKRRIANRDERIRLRNALYAELGSNLEILFIYSLDLYNMFAGNPSKFPSLDKIIRRDVLDKAAKEQPVTFRELGREATVISSFYDAIPPILDMELGERVVAIDHLQSWIEDIINRQRYLSKRKLRKVMTTPPPAYRNPTIARLQKRYNQVIERNIPKTPELAYKSPENLYQHIKAICRGIPGDSFPYKISSRQNAPDSTNPSSPPTRQLPPSQ